MASFVYWWLLIGPWVPFPLLAWLGYMLWRLRGLQRRCEAELEGYIAESDMLHRVIVICLECATQSFLYQHLPFWQPWSEMTGISFSMRVGRRDNGKQ